MNKHLTKNKGSVTEDAASRKDTINTEQKIIKKDFDIETNDSSLLKNTNLRFNLRTRSRTNEERITNNKRLLLTNSELNYSKTKRLKQCSLENGQLKNLHNNNAAIKTKIYNANEFLAVRNEDDNFFLCQAKQNIYKNGRKIRIQWYNNNENPEIYIPDFEDLIDFECILTNLRIVRLEKKGVSLPIAEKNRAMNILERAINVEKGINEPPDPRKVLSDGLDISIIGKIKEEDVLSKLNTDENNAKKKANKKTSVNNEQKKTKNSIDSKELTNLEKSSDLSELSPYSPVYSINNLISDESMQNGFQSIENEDPAINENDSNEKDIMFETKTPLPFISSYVNAKLLIRAVILEDYEFLETFLHNNICSISIPRSVSTKRNAIHYAIQKEDLKSFKILMEIEKNINVENNHLPYSMELYHSELMMDTINHQQKMKRKNFPLDDSYAKFTLKQQLIKFDFIQKIIPFFKNGLEGFFTNILTLFKTGSYHLALSLTKKICEIKNDNVNQTYHKVLLANFSSNVSSDLSEFIECINDSLNLYPIHLAAINPDSRLFHDLIYFYPNQIYLADVEGWMPIHFASVCQTYFNLKQLLNIGVSTRLTDSKGNTPLHLATKYNRINNVALIIRYESSQPLNSSLNSYNNKGYTPFHIACKNGFTNIVQLLIERAVSLDFATSNNSGELTSLMIASKYGHLNIVKKLIENGATINMYDKKNRNALTYAVINGHSNIVTYFLNLGANPSGKDLFGNNLFHYALAYGWHCCFELLLKTNINLKDTNTFGLTPIYAAFMKGHVGFIEYILKKNILNVNVPVNDTGINLVMLTFTTIPNRKSIDYLKLFVEKFKCDLSKTDYEGNNTLHHLLKCEAKYKNSNSSVINSINNILTILLQNGCDIYLNNNAGISPITFSLLNQCFQSFSRFFKDHHKSNRFQQILSTNEYLWPMIISNVLSEIIVNKTNVITFGRYIINVAKQDRNFMNLLKSLAQNTNISGDLPIEYFIKISKRLSNETRTIENKMIIFFDFLLQFYEREFLEDIFIIHLAAKFGSASIIKRLVEIVTNIDVPNESNHTPFATAIINDNICAAEIFLTLKINFNVEINQTSSFFHYLKNSSSLCLVPLFIKYGVDVKQIDSFGNTSLHAICQNIVRDSFIETVKIFIEQGINVNLKNSQGQTVLHVAFKMNKYSSHLCQLWEILMKNEFDPYSRDQSGYNAFSYLFLNECFRSQPNLLELMGRNSFKHIDWQLFFDKNQVNLLHYSAKMGLSQCINYLLFYIDPNIVDDDNHSPLSLAILNGHRDCTLILLKSDKVRILDNLEFISKKKNTKINLLWHIWNNGWKDAFFIIEEKAIRQNELSEFIQILIKSQCLEYALYLMRSTEVVNLESLKSYLLLFGKYTTNQVESNIQNEFLRFFQKDLICTVYAELFSSAFYNCNSNLCFKLIDLFGIMKILKKLKEKCIDLIPLSFRKLIYDDHLSTEMKNLIEKVSQEQEINILSNYPIIERKDSVMRYSFYDFEHEQQKYSSIKYSPLIIGIIKKSHSTVKWLLNLRSDKKFLVDINFTDSQERIPLIHAILNNDFKMIKLILNINEGNEHINHFSSARRIKLLKRDINNLTIFHYLISPFEFGNFYKAEDIYSMLWKLVDQSEKTPDFINELYRYANKKKAFNIIYLMDKLTNHTVPRQINFESVANNENNKKLTLVNFQSDYEAFIKSNTLENNVNSNLNAISKEYNKNIITDESSNIPYDVTFTKLDNQENNYVYNFYKVQLISMGNKYCLLIRWGHVGTVGNIKKIFYDLKEDGINNFKKIFANKSGENWTQVNFYVTQDKYKMVTSDKLIDFNCCNMNWNIEELLKKLSLYECYLSQNFKRLILKIINRIKLIEHKRDYYKNLSTRSMERCAFILNRLSKLIAYYNFKINKVKNQNQKENLKLLNDIIDLSEQFYGYLKIFGNEVDQLKPILTMQDVQEKSDLIKKLKSIIFSMEFLFFVLNSNTKNINPWDYIHSSLKWNCQISSEICFKEESDFIKSYLSSSEWINENELNIFKISNSNNNTNQIPNKKTYLLWYHLKNYEFFDFFINGFEYQMFLFQSNPQIIINGIHLTNRLNNEDFEEDDCLILCETLIENPLEINDINDIEIKNSLLRNKDCIIINSTKNQDDYDYLFWRGFVVPINNFDGRRQFIHLSTNQLRPRYIIEFKQKSISSP